MDDFEDEPFSSVEQADLRDIRDILHRNEGALVAVLRYLSILLTDPPDESLRSDPGETASDEEIQAFADWQDRIDFRQDLAQDWQLSWLAELRSYRTEETGPSETAEAREEQIRTLRDLALEVRAASSAVIKTTAALASDRMDGTPEMWRRVLIRLYEKELGIGEDDSAS